MAYLIFRGGGTEPCPGEGAYTSITSKNCLNIRSINMVESNFISKQRIETTGVISITLIIDWTNVRLD